MTSSEVHLPLPFLYRQDNAISNRVGAGGLLTRGQSSGGLSHSSFCVHNIHLTALLTRRCFEKLLRKKILSHLQLLSALAILLSRFLCLFLDVGNNEGCLLNTWAAFWLQAQCLLFLYRFFYTTPTLEEAWRPHHQSPLIQTLRAALALIYQQVCHICDSHLRRNPLFLLKFQKQYNFGLVRLDLLAESQSPLTYGSVWQHPHPYPSQ